MLKGMYFIRQISVYNLVLFFVYLRVNSMSISLIVVLSNKIKELDINPKNLTTKFK